MAYQIVQSEVHWNAEYYVQHTPLVRLNQKATRAVHLLKLVLLDGTTIPGWHHILKVMSREV